MAALEPPIVAIATAPGRGAVGIVRISGTGLVALIPGLLGEAASRLQPRRALHASVLDRDGQSIDSGLVLWFPAPASYTGEDVLELQGHGGPVVLRSVLKRCLELGQDQGLRLAEPGEFTRRAYLNERIDLAQAEAVADLIDAATESAARSALRSLVGEFSRAVDLLIEDLIDLRLRTEAAIDFPEEDIELMALTDGRERLARLRQRFSSVRDRARHGARLREGLRVVLVGAPNVGKSSLLNALAGEEIAIVTEVAGTTRDRIVQSLDLDGLPVQVIDTAGLRPTADAVERIGIERTLEAVAQADVILHVVDASVPGSVESAVAAPAVPGPDRCASNAGTPASAGGPVVQTPMAVAEADQAVLRQLAAHQPPSASRLVVANKIDLLPGSGPPASERVIFLSARSGAGLAQLRQRLLDVAGWHGADDAQTVFLARERHLLALGEAEAALANAQRELDQRRPALEIFAEELRLAQAALARIGGEFTADDLLGRIFSRFCIGK